MDVFQSYTRHFTPGNIVLAGAGVDHEELVRLGEKYFGGLETVEGGGAWASARDAGVTESKYHGGESRIVIGADKVKKRHNRVKKGMGLVRVTGIA